MAVSVYRCYEVTWRIAIGVTGSFKYLRPLVAAPTIISATLAGGGKVYLFVVILPHITDKHVSISAVKAKAPGITQAIMPNFWLSTWRRDKGIAGGNAVSLRSACICNVYAQNLAQVRAQALAIAI